MTTIPLPWDRPTIALNDSHGNRWAEASGRRQVRTEARWAIRTSGVVPVTDYPVRVTIHWRIPDRRLRDADRLHKVAKGCQDALVDEGVLAGDDWRYVRESASRIHPPEVGKPGAMWLEVAGL